MSSFSYHDYRGSIVWNKGTRFKYQKKTAGSNFFQKFIGTSFAEFYACIFNVV
jgi:hypothetical protein